MKDPVKLALKKALCAALQGITKDAGYSMDVATVRRDQIGVGTNDTLPLITVLESPEQKEVIASPETSTQIVESYQLIIQGFLNDGDKSVYADSADWLRADVKRMLAQEIYQRGNGITRKSGFFGVEQVLSMSMTSGIVRPPDRTGAATGIESKYSFFWLVLDTSLVEDLLNPY